MTETPPDDTRLLKLKCGELLEFVVPDAGQTESEEEKRARTIPANWLEALLEKQARKVHTAVQIRGAIIVGQLNLSYAAFECEVSFVGCQFIDWVDLFFASFGRSSIFRDCLFSDGATFRGIHTKTDLDIVGSRWGDDASFQDAQITESLYASGTRFMGECNFERIAVGKSAIFRSDPGFGQVEFNSAANFSGARINGQADFSGSKFKGKANFDGLSVKRDIFFGPDLNRANVLFESDTDFSGASVSGLVKFDSAKFVGQAQFNDAHFCNIASFQGVSFLQSAIFDRIQIDGPGLFCVDKDNTPVTFSGIASFNAAYFRGDAEFVGAEFKDQANFQSLKVDGLALFSRLDCITQFNKGSKFASATFLANADFSGAHFKSGVTDFSYCQFKGRLDFEATIFAGAVALRETSADSVLFARQTDVDTSSARLGIYRDSLSDVAKFGNAIDFRGFVYDRICVRLSDLFCKLAPYDRQVYDQLEHTFRNVGDDRQAIRTYLQRRKRERQANFRWNSTHIWFGSWLYKLGANYGVRPYPLILWALVSIFCGALLFSNSGALEAKQQNLPSTAAANNCSSARGLWEALPISVHYFLPMDVPVGAECVPSNKIFSAGVSAGRIRIELSITPSWYATLFLRLAGAVLMTIGFAAVTGLLRRIAP